MISPVLLHFCSLPFRAGIAFSLLAFDGSLAFDESYVRVSITKDGPDYLAELNTFDFETGVQRQSRQIARTESEAKTAVVFDRKGRTLILTGVRGSKRTAELAASAQWEDSPATSIEAYGRKSLRLPTLSPDGKALVAFDYPKSCLVLATASETLTVPVPARWRVTHPFSWSPDSSQIAFYFATGNEEDDAQIQKHGIALLTIGGELNLLRSPPEDAGTPLSDAKDVRIGWADGHIYFTEGRLPPDAPTDPAARRVRARRAVTLRLNVETESIEEIAEGEFCDIAADGSFVVTNGLIRKAEKWSGQAWVVDLNTRARRELPPGVVYPKLSPSGRFAAALLKDSVVLLRTDTWQITGQPVPRGPGPFAVKEWSERFQWILGDPANANDSE